jgi:hypothetical protein
MIAMAAAPPKWVVVVVVVVVVNQYQIYTVFFNSNSLKKQ